jgi:K(+)-stimulated pyrophosphate-energized sodium pump
MPVQVLVALASGLVALIFAAYLAFGRVMKAPPGNEEMVRISGAIQEGAMAFLAREYRAIAVFVVVLAVIIVFGIRGETVGLGWKTAIAFVVGALCSASAGFVGMWVATRANSRTAQAATEGFNRALKVAFPGGAVMGFTVVGVGLAGLSLVFYVFGTLDQLSGAAEIIAGFSMGASSIALFARVGGGIYTKAADVGADLVGKVEAGIPEDDPRNAATIADNVGDNVGDVAGMGADLFESYVGTLVSAIVIAVSTMSAAVRLSAVSYAFSIAAVGILASLLGVFFVRIKEGGDPQHSLRNGTVASALLFILGLALITFIGYRDLQWTATPMGSTVAKSYGPGGLFLSTIFGLLAGLIVSFVAEFYTSGRSIREIARASRTGSATNIIAGFATGMKSAVIPLIVLGAAIMLAYNLAGFFGIALAAIGMLGITGMTVAVDAYGPIADNAGGIAEMSKMPPEVRKVTDRLDAAGNTTAAIAKGFAIGSAALTALALFMAYVQRTGIRPEDFNIMNVRVLSGLLVGGVVPYVFASDTMRAVGRAAFSVVEEVRRQFKEIPGLMEGKAQPEYARCVDITTEAALKEMIVPGVMAVLIPLVVGIFFGVETLGGLLAGALVSGVPLALLLANAGGAWDNAKKYIETGVDLELGGKGSDAHKAAVVGDTVGDPFKDTSGPSLNILLKLMAIVSLVFAPLIMLLNEKMPTLF